MVKKAAQATPNELLIRARLERGWTQKNVADRVGAPFNLNVNRWERGITRPSAYYIQRLCEVFGKSASELGLLPPLPQSEDQETITSDKPEEESSETPAASDTFNVALWNVPFARNPFFTGRGQLLERLHEQLSHSSSTAFVSRRP